MGPPKLQLESTVRAVFWGTVPLTLELDLTPDG